MKSTRAVYTAEQDYTWPDAKKAKRSDYLKLAIRDFLEQQKELRGFLEDAKIREMARQIIDSYEIVREKIVQRVPHPGRKHDFKYFDHHKIIAGTQLAVLTALPLRTAETESISVDDVHLDPHGYFDVISLNTHLAVFISLDILHSWFGLSVDGFYRRQGLHDSCLVQLANYCGIKKSGVQKQDDFPFFWCSMLWYAIEEILRKK